MLVRVYWLVILITSLADQHDQPQLLKTLPLYLLKKTITTTTKKTVLTLGLHNVAVSWNQRATPLMPSDLPAATPTAEKISSLLSSQLKRNPGWTCVLGHNPSTSTTVRLNTTTIGILPQAAISLRARKRGGSRLRRTCVWHELRYCNRHFLMRYMPRKVWNSKPGNPALGIACSIIPLLHAGDTFYIGVILYIFKMQFIQMYDSKNNYIIIAQQFQFLIKFLKNLSQTRVLWSSLPPPAVWSWQKHNHLHMQLSTATLSTNHSGHLQDQYHVK